MMTLSLAPWKYRNVTAGPIARLSYRASRLIDGQTVFDAYAYLKASPAREVFQVYGSVDGNGTHATKHGAIHRAISEALERWAFHDTWNSHARVQYGFDVDPSTTGMAAFPGLNSRSARDTAYREAVERWSLVEWWRGHLAHEVFTLPGQPHIEALAIESLCADAITVILWTNVPGTQATAYAFAAGTTRMHAVKKALIELTRNVRVLQQFFASAHASQKPTSSTERRLMYFAGVEGAQAFRKRVATHLRNGNIQAPKLIVDTTIKGPWTHYAHVWRCLFDSTPVNREDDTFFLF